MKKATAMGMATRNTMVVPCMVNISLYVSGEMNAFSGRMSWMRMSSASKPPTNRKKKEVRKYMTPIRL